MKIYRNIKLAKYTTFHIGGRAEFFAKIKNIDDIKKAVKFANKNNLKIFVLGGGSNILLPDRDMKVFILKIDIKGVSFKNTRIFVGAGERWDYIVARAIQKNLGGMENLSLIPGSVGGAVYQNIGAYGVELKDILESVEIMDLKTLKVGVLTNKGCRFDYRASIFQEPKGENYIILKAVFKLSKNHVPNISYPDLIKYFESKKSSIQEIRKAVIQIRKSKLEYPTAKIGTAGSFFKNPIISSESYQLLVADYQDLKGKDFGNGLIKLSAGQLIEQVGLRGKKLGNAGVSKKHALVLVSYPSGKSADIIKLARLIQNSIKIKFNISLEPEVNIMA